MKTKSLASIVLSAFLTVSPVSKAFSEKVTEKVIVTDLTGIVYKLSESEVLNQLKDLASNSPKEDGWYYITDTKEFIDKGTDVRVGRYRPDSSVILKKSPRPKEIIIYHIHPVSHSALESYPKGFLKKLAGLQPPSFEDISYWLYESELLKKEGIRVTEFRVVDCMGYWSVNLEMSKLKKLDSNEFYIKYDSLLKEHMTDYIRNYWINKDNGAAPHVQRCFIKLFEEKATCLGLYLAYNPI